MMVKAPLWISPPPSRMLSAMLCGDNPKTTTNNLVHMMQPQLMGPLLGAVTEAANHQAQTKDIAPAKNSYLRNTHNQDGGFAEP